MTKLEKLEAEKLEFRALLQWRNDLLDYVSGGRSFVLPLGMKDSARLTTLARKFKYDKDFQDVNFGPMKTAHTRSRKRP